MCTYEGRPIIGKDEGDGCEGIIRRYAGRAPIYSRKFAWSL